MMWFGRPWSAATCAPEKRSPTPVGEPCLHCREAITAGEDGVLMPYPPPLPGPRPIHRYCHLRMRVGGLNHQLRTCFCCGGQDEMDPAGLTKREAAVVAGRYYERRQAILARGLRPTEQALAAVGPQPDRMQGPWGLGLLTAATGGGRIANKHPVGTLPWLEWVAGFSYWQAGSPGEPLPSAGAPP